MSNPIVKVECDSCNSKYNFGLPKSVLQNPNKPMAFRCSVCGYRFNIQPTDLLEQPDVASQFVRVEDEDTIRVFNSLPQVQELIDDGQINPTANISVFGKAWEKIGSQSDLRFASSDSESEQRISSVETDEVDANFPQKTFKQSEIQEDPSEEMDEQSEAFSEIDPFSTEQQDSEENAIEFEDDITEKMGSQIDVESQSSESHSDEVDEVSFDDWDFTELNDDSDEVSSNKTNDPIGAIEEAVDESADDWDIVDDFDDSLMDDNSKDEEYSDLENNVWEFLNEDELTNEKDLSTKTGKSQRKSDSKESLSPQLSNIAPDRPQPDRTQPARPQLDRAQNVTAELPLESDDWDFEEDWQENSDDLNDEINQEYDKLVSTIPKPDMSTSMFDDLLNLSNKPKVKEWTEPIKEYDVEAEKDVFAKAEEAIVEAFVDDDSHEDVAELNIADVEYEDSDEETPHKSSSKERLSFSDYIPPVPKSKRRDINPVWVFSAILLFCVLLLGYIVWEPTFSPSSSLENEGENGLNPTSDVVASTDGESDGDGMNGGAGSKGGSSNDSQSNTDMTDGFNGEFPVTLPEAAEENLEFDKLDTADSLSRKAWQAYNKENFDKALRLFKLALKKDRDHQYAIVGIGKTLEAIGQIEDGSAELCKAIESAKASAMDVVYWQSMADQNNHLCN